MVHQPNKYVLLKCGRKYGLPKSIKNRLHTTLLKNMAPGPAMAFINPCTAFCGPPAHVERGLRAALAVSETWLCAAVSGYVSLCLTSSAGLDFVCRCKNLELLSCKRVSRNRCCTVLSSFGRPKVISLDRGTQRLASELGSPLGVSRACF